jgi:tetratricopeptide (TPR) repeat protein
VKEEVAKAARGRGHNAEAHRLRLQGRHFIDRFARVDTAKGIGYLKEALNLDPEFALAWADLGQAYSREADLGWVPMAEGYGRAREAVERALSLEPHLAEGHAEKGWIHMAFDWDWAGAEASYRRALELAPGNALVLSGVGTLADALGHAEEAIQLYRRALEQDPLSSTSYSNLGAALRTADRLGEAEEVYRKALELAPGRVSTHANLSLVLLAQGRREDALAEAMREPHGALRLWALAIVYDAAGRGAESDEALRNLLDQYADDFAYQISAVHAARGSADLAFEWLERAYQQRDGGLAELKASTRFRSLHGDPRWGAFMKKLGFEE